MDDILWMDFLEEEVTDLSTVILTIGVNGLLGCFEAWLYEKGHLVRNEN